MTEIFIGDQEIGYKNRAQAQQNKSLEEAIYTSRTTNK